MCLFSKFSGWQETCCFEERANYSSWKYLWPHLEQLWFVWRLRVEERSTAGDWYTSRSYELHNKHSNVRSKCLWCMEESHLKEIWKRRGKAKNGDKQCSNEDRQCGKTRKCSNRSSIYKNNWLSRFGNINYRDQYWIMFWSFLTCVVRLGPRWTWKLMKPLKPFGYSLRTTSGFIFGLLYE